jgi:hypothetical protein
MMAVMHGRSTAAAPLRREGHLACIGGDVQGARTSISLVSISRGRWGGPELFAANAKLKANVDPKTDSRLNLRFNGYWLHLRRERDMKCHLYMRLIDGASKRLGPYDICDEAQARRLAQTELAQNPDLQAVDIWWDNGELYRIERGPEPAPGAAGAAWANAFGRGPPERPNR